MLSQSDPLPNTTSFPWTPKQVPTYELKANRRALSDDRYDPVADAPFRYSEPPPFSFLAEAFEEVSNASGKNSKALQKEIIANVFRSIIILRPDHLVKAFYLSIGRLAPDYKGIETGVGNETLYKAVAKATGVGEREIKRFEKEEGDLGVVFSKKKATQGSISLFCNKQTKVTPQSIAQVYDELLRLALAKGANSAAAKENQLIRLLRVGSPLEGKYVVRFGQKSLKIGASELTMQSALARAIALTPPVQADFPPAVLKSHSFSRDEVMVETLVKSAISECPDYDVIIGTLLRTGPAGEPLDYVGQVCRIRPGVPIKPMLAKPTKGIGEILKRFTDVEFTCEFKYDGMRAQIHMVRDAGMQIYSRNSENVTGMYPDLLQMLNAHIDRSQVNDCILDSEVVAFDRSSNRILPFQSIQHRKRTDVEVADITVEVCIYLFDVMYLNGESLMKKPLVERREILRRTIEEVPGKMQMVQFQNTTSFEDIEQLLMDSVKIGCEGLMVKSLKERAEYEPSKRSFNWLKLKKDYIDNNTQLGDSVDLVPIGADLGTGKRTGVYGSFLLAAYDETNSEFQSVCKIGTGFSDEFLQEAYKTLSEWELQRPRRDYRTNQQMDVWFEAKVVWEVKAADLSLSSVHMAACGKIAENKGIALRFPRFMKTRPDKSPEQATSTEQLADMYQSQSAVTHLQPEAAEEYDDEELI